MSRWMVTGRRRSLLAVLATLVLSAVYATALGAGAPVAAAAGADEALPDFGACLRAQHRGDLVVLIDSSSSLRSTDPANARVTAAQLLLARLSAAAAKANFTMNVAITGFDASLSQATPWTVLNSQGLPALNAAVSGFAVRDKGFETDYWTALTTARALLAGRQPGTDPSRRCQAMLLFTDGQYVLSPRTDPQEFTRYGATKPIPGVSDVRIDSRAAADRVAAAGRQDLCRPGGVADQLRVDGVTTIAVGLASTASAGTRDFSLLSKLAVNADKSCGKQPGRGVFLPATDVSDLVLIFDGIGSLNHDMKESTKAVCPVTACPNSAHSFVLDPSITSIHLVGTANVSPIEVLLQLPGVPAVPLRYAAGTRQLKLATTTLTLTWYRPEVISIDASYGSPQAWSGRWSLTFIDPTGKHADAISKVQLSISGDLAGEMAPADPITAGRPVDLRLGLVRDDGTPAQLGIVRPRITADVSAVSTAGSSRRTVSISQGLAISAAETPVDWAVPADFPAGSAVLVVVLHVRTLTGLQLVDQTRQTPVKVNPAPGIPQLGPLQISFGRLPGTAAGHARINVTGSGCVWLKSSDLTVFPEPAQSASVSSAYRSPAHCLAGHDGGSVVLPVTLEHRKQANGQLQGVLVFGAAPAGQTDNAGTVEVRFTASLERLPNKPVKWLVFVVCLLVGIGVPLLVLAYLRYRAARLPAGALQSVVFDVTVDDSLLNLANGNSADPSNWTSSGQVDDARKSVMLGPSSARLAARARAGLRLDQPGYAVLEVAPQVGCGSAPPHTSKQGLPTLPLELSGGWAFFAANPPGDGPIAGRLLLVVAQLAPPSTMAEALARGRSEVPAVVARCRSGWPAGQPPEQQGPPATKLSPTGGPAAAPQWGPSLNPDAPFG